ncbi:MAG: S1 family peptidase [Nitrospirota bacterium]|nr:S1 family peptidase [Nitrospirota bacterium]
MKTFFRPHRNYTSVLFIVALTLSFVLLAGGIGFQGPDNATAFTAGQGNVPAVLDKNNPQIRAVMAIQNRHTPELMALPDVVGTATGLTEDGRPAVFVFTKRIGTRGIPASLEGTPVKVSVTGEFYALRPGKGSSGTATKVSTTSVLTPPVPIGVSTGNENECSAGTIGARVTDGVHFYALSNNHVYALENDAPQHESNRVLQPGLYDTGCIAGGNFIGELPRDRVSDFFIPINFGTGSNTVDAALALIYADSNGSPMLGNATPPNGYGTPDSTTADAAIRQAVQKYGRTSQLTAGTVTAINGMITINYGAAGNAAFNNQIIVQSAKPFIKPGDSGSLLVTKTGLKAVGLLFAGDSTGKYAIANDIDTVLTLLSHSLGTTLRIDGN